MTQILLSPSIRRRFAAMAYEAVLLFGLLFATGLIFGTLLQQRHALLFRSELQAVVTFVMGLYFVWFWSHGGQTLAMKTWRVRLLTAQGRPVPMLRAGVRYVLCWLWVAPGLLVAALVGAKGWWLALIPAANVAAWAALALADPARQFLHDRLAGTRLVREEAPPAITAPPTSRA